MTVQRKKFPSQNSVWSHKWKLLAVVLLLLSNVPEALGAHLVGGHISYRFLNRSGNGANYEIKVAIYRDCNHTTPYDADIQIGIYPASLGAGLTTTLNLYNPVIKPINPLAGGSPCPGFEPNACLEEGIYRGTVYLPDNSVGYYATHLRCCRNDQENLVDFSGQTYHCFIPPNSYRNSSPDFTDPPVPYFCFQDTLTLLYFASESDGDSLVYSLVHPYHGADQSNPKPTIPANNYSNPPLVSYKWGYNASNPFGNGGFCEIDKHSGAVTVMVPKQGLYSIAVDVKEYRNGVHIGTIRRDVQLIILPCPPNAPPQRVTPNESNGGINAVLNEYRFYGGDQLKVNFAFEDPDGVEFSYSGEPFTTQAPRAVFEGGVSANGKRINGTFTWQTDCHHIRTTPYIINFQVRDKGCPSKVSNFTIRVYVDRPPNPLLSGKISVCHGETTMYYPQPGHEGVLYEFENAVLENKSSDTVWVRFPNPGNARIKVQRKIGPCVSETTIVNVQVKPKSSLPVVTKADTVVCKGIPVLYHGPVNNPVSNYRWFVDAKATILQGQNTVSAEIVFNDTGRSVVKFVDIGTGDACPSDTVFIPVRVAAPVVESIKGPLSVCPYARNIDYVTEYQPGSQYFWFAEGGVVNTTDNAYATKIVWGEMGTGKVKVVEVTKEGCVSDTIETPVLIDYTLHTPPIEGDTVVCEFVREKEYEVIRSNGSTYSWTISGGTIVSGQGTHKITVDWEDAGQGLLRVQEFAWDDVNNRACVGIPVILLVRIAPTPDPQPTASQQEVCQYEEIRFDVTGFPNSLFFWAINGQPIDTTHSGASAVSRAMDEPGSYVVSVVEQSQDSCLSNVKTLNVTVFPRPVTTDIVGDSAICRATAGNRLYSVSGYPTSTFSWSVDGGTLRSGQGTPTVVVDWNEHGRRSIQVAEISEHGCVGDTISLPVDVDFVEVKMLQVGTLREDHTAIRVDWTLLLPEYVKRPQMVFRAEGDGSFRLIDSVNYPQTWYIDRRVNTGQHNYRYQIGVHNQCGDLAVDAPHRSILLGASLASDTLIQKWWNPYEGWNPQGYELYRAMNNDTGWVLVEDAASSGLISTSDYEGWKQCYRVRATVPSGDTVLQSWSNAQCFQFEPYVYIPNAFTPDGTDLNEVFKVYAAHFISYHITIYNRWGERLFESRHPRDAWDGTFRGQPCAEGAYLYIVDVKGYRRTIHKKGMLYLLK